MSLTYRGTTNYKDLKRNVRIKLQKDGDFLVYKDKQIIVNGLILYDSRYISKLGDTIVVY